MGGGILAVAAEEAAGGPPPTPSSDRADATMAVPTTAVASPTDSPAASRPFNGDPPDVGVAWHGVEASD